jgi:tryptophan halogenase
MAVPASLAHRIALLRESARVFRAPNELFAENAWIQVMLGQGITPEQHHRVTDLMGDAELTHFLEEIGNGVNRTVMQMPRNQDDVTRYSGRPGRDAAGA